MVVWVAKAQSVLLLHSALSKGTSCAVVQPWQLLAALLHLTKPLSRLFLLKPGRFTALIATILLLLLVSKHSCARFAGVPCGSAAASFGAPLGIIAHTMPPLFSLPCS